jgi:hypothetical protein
LKKKVEQE